MSQLQLRASLVIVALMLVALFGIQAAASPTITDPANAAAAVCNTCQGSGTSSFQCFQCNGSGKNSSGFKCSFCNGKGFSKCASCNGTGQK